jgi:GT2 family glycosyltransferase
MTECEAQLEDPSVSVVVLNYNGKRFILDCLNTILASDYPRFEVILVDNCSLDGSIAVVEEEYGLDKRLKIVANRRNLGIAEGYNMGLAHSKGALIVFLNQDTQVDPEWLGEIARIFASYDDVGVAQPLLVHMNDKQRIQSTGTLLTQTTWPSSRPKEKTGQGNLPSILACGAAFAVRRQILDTIGAFDPTYFINFEDIDLSLRVWLSGRRVVLAERSLVYHYDSSSIERKTLAKPSSLREFHSAKNVIVTLIKNFETRSLVRFLPATLLFTLCRGLYVSVRQGNPTVFSYTVKGLSWPVFNLRKILIKRSLVQSRIRKVSDEYVLKRVYSTVSSWK